MVSRGHTIIGMREEVLVYEGETAKLNCTTVDSSARNVHWYKGNQSLPNKVAFLQQRLDVKQFVTFNALEDRADHEGMNVLVINRTTLTDEGTYICTPQGRMISTIHLNIYGELAWIIKHHHHDHHDLLLLLFHHHHH